MKIAPDVEKMIPDICRKFNIRILALFGSFLTGTPRDIDFAVFPGTGTDPGDIDRLGIISELESLFRKKADVTIIHSGTSTTLLFEICKNSLLLYEDEDGGFEHERSVAFRKYADTFKFRRLREKNIKNFVKGVDSVSRG